MASDSVANAALYELDWTLMLIYLFLSLLVLGLLVFFVLIEMCLCVIIDNTLIMCAGIGR